MRRETLITVSGPPGSGTSTLCDKLTEKYSIEHISGGDIFREMASQRGMTLAELTQAAADDDTIDREVDTRLQERIDEFLDGDTESPNVLIVESRLAGWHADGRQDLAVWLDAPASVRSERISSRDETVTEIQQREKLESKRYQEYYGIDISDLSIYDLTVDTATFSESGVAAIVESCFKDMGIAESGSIL